MPQQLRWSQFECIGDPTQRVDRYVACGPFHQGDVGAVEIGLLGESLLREAAGFSSLTDGDAEPRRERAHHMRTLTAG